MRSRFCVDVRSLLQEGVAHNILNGSLHVEIATKTHPKLARTHGHRDWRLDPRHDQLSIANMITVCDHH